MKFKLILSLVSLAALLLAASPKKTKPLDKLPKDLRKSFAYIPHLTYNLESEFTTSYSWLGGDSSMTVSLMSFYCSITEVSNAQYREFLSHVEDPNKLKIAQIDTARWRTEFSYGEPLVELYHMHPAYDEYPVVNVPYEGAIMYCDWLEKKLNYNNQTSYVYRVNLPTRNEWVAAAKGGLELSPYPWGGPYLKNLEGCTLANFDFIGSESIRYNDSTEQYEVMPVIGGSNIKTKGCDWASDMTAPVESYFPNDFNLYNMSGNVAEMVLEEGMACGGGWRSPGFDIRCVSTMRYVKPQPDVGFRPVIKLEKR